MAGIKFQYFPDGCKPDILTNEGEFAGLTPLKHGMGIRIIETEEIDGYYIYKIHKLEVPCYLNWIAPFLNNCLRSEGVIPSLLACPIVEASE